MCKNIVAITYYIISFCTLAICLILLFALSGTKIELDHRYRHILHLILLLHGFFGNKLLKLEYKNKVCLWCWLIFTCVYFICDLLNYIYIKSYTNWSIRVFGCLSRGYVLLKCVKFLKSIYKPIILAETQDDTQSSEWAKHF